MRTDADPSTGLPTEPFSVVWSRGHCYVREATTGRARWTGLWMGIDDRGRPQALTDADLHRRGWSLRRG